MFWLVFIYVLLIAIAVNIVFVVIRFTVTSTWRVIWNFMHRERPPSPPTINWDEEDSNVIPFRPRRPF